MSLMQMARFLSAADWNAPGSAYQNAFLDSAVNVSAYGHPAVVGAVNITSTVQFTGGQAFTGSPALPADILSSAFGPVGNRWSQVGLAVVTTQAGDTYSFSTTARQVTLTFAGIVASGAGFVSGDTGLVSGALRNGAVATVSVDGVVQATIDTDAGTPQAVLHLDGARHTILVTHTGGYSTAIHPIGAVTALVGSSVAAGTSVTALYHPTFITASWRLAATDATHYTLFRTLPGASETTIAAGLITGTTYADNAHVPGVSLMVTGTLVAGDSATFTTDVTQVAFTTVLAGYSSGGGGTGIVYTSPVIDGGMTDTQWFTAEWTQGSALALSSFVLRTGNTPTPDASWSPSVAITPINTTLPSTLAPLGVAGLQMVPRARYAQFQATFTVGATPAPFIRDLTLTYWVPERDPQFLGKVPQAAVWAPGPVMTGFLGALSCELATTRQKGLDYVAAFGIAAAVDQYLQAYGRDFGLPQWTGESQIAYRQTLIAALSSRGAGGSRPTIAAIVAAFLGYAPAQIGVTTLGAAFQYQVAVPAPVAGPGGTYYPNLPGLPVAQVQTMVKALVSLINPVTSVITPLNSSSNVVFA